MRFSIDEVVVERVDADHTVVDAGIVINFRSVYLESGFFLRVLHLSRVRAGLSKYTSFYELKPRVILGWPQGLRYYTCGSFTIRNELRILAGQPY